VSRPRSAYRAGGKRFLDLVAALTALILLSPILLALAVGVLTAMGRPVLFRQARAGRGGRPFPVVKFRTMRSGRGTDADRLTPFGRWLRRTSLDELPELWNVLKGDMSLVGPRPLHLRYLPRYTAEQARRHEIRPGISGWAQVNGRNTTIWEERFRLDVWYVDHYSLALDLRILWRTVAQVASGHGVTAADHATMPEFQPDE